MRSTHFVSAREYWYTPEGKSKVVTCAEHTFCQCKRTLVHVRKEKQGGDVCGAHILSVQENVGTRQKGKASLWRVQSVHFVSERECWHTPKRKNHLTFPALPYKMMVELR